MRKQQDDISMPDTVSWPGPVGWWYIPLIWTIIAVAAALYWTL
jgi:hypothetical protein